jgi:hypothetical protein
MKCSSAFIIPGIFAQDLPDLRCPSCTRADNAITDAGAGYQRTGLGPALMG